MNDHAIQSEILQLQEINGKYRVPAYQRLYTWDREQVRTLMEDLLTSFRKHRADKYYLGSILVSAANEELDLIDGQQRFTTLTLLAKELKLSLGFELDFASRKNLLQELEALDQEADAAKEMNPGIIKLRDAQKEIEDQLHKSSEQDAQPVDKKDFAVYLARNVQLVQIQVPKGMDLNQLFEVINNRGMQLEQHQLLKGRLLHYLDDKKKAFYGEIWEACAQMDQYLERVPGKRFKAAVGASVDFLSRDALKPEPDSSGEEANERSLSAILQKEPGQEPGEVPSKDEESHKQANGTPVQSIMGFPLFLLHVLRIFNIKHEHKRDDIPSLQDKNLIKIFDESWLKGLEVKGAKTEVQNDVIEFIELLAQIRWLFDGQVIKWVGEGQERELMLRKLERSKDSIIRNSEDSKPELSLLQAMLYHTQPLTAQQWLTPYLFFLYQQSQQTDTSDLTVKATRYLQWLDNTLFCEEATRGTLLERTRALMEGSRPASDEAEKQFQWVKSRLAGSKGTEFHHYWFYKVEYLLYYLARFPEGEDGYPAIKKLKTEGYRMTARNSIEHLFPQSEKDKLEGEDKDKVLNSFGNLALVSSSFNSGLSNKNVLEKKAYFEKHRQMNLKLELMLSQVDERTDIAWEKRWNASHIEAHLKTLTACFQAYLRLTGNEPFKA